MNLVIVESPSKAKTIAKYLGKDYQVVASKGHVVDLPKSGLAVDVEDDFKIDYIVTKPEVVKGLVKLAKSADEVILALDPDREGEAIAWHIARELKILSKDYQRIVFHEITQTAVADAVKQPRKIDMALVNAQQARRVLDRLVGYKLSPLLWKKVRFGLSAGRVQSVALRLIVEREQERDRFVPEEYWDISANVSLEKVKVKLQVLTAETKEEEEQRYDLLDFKLLSTLKGEKVLLANQKGVEKVLANIQQGAWEVLSSEVSQVQKRPDSPLSTSLLQQAGVNKLKMSASKVMRVAQELYEQGHITYMRTDSVHLAQTAVSSIRKYIEKQYGKDFIPQSAPVYKSKAKVAQEAHEAIRPTDITRDANKLGLVAEAARVYELIRTRTLASQMAPAVLNQRTIKLKAGEYIMQGVARDVAFPGFFKVITDRDEQPKVLPQLEVGQDVYPTEINAFQHFTQPPPRYSEATLIKELERLGIGRPSTYAPIIQTIQGRDYVEKLGAYFKPTDVGIVVIRLLTDHFEEIMNVNFTAGMEDELDQVANGELDWQKMLANFYKPFAKNLEKQEQAIARGDYTTLAESDKKCPICGKKMIVKLGKNGRFLSCSNFPDCKGILDIDGKSPEDYAAKAETAEFLETYLPAPITEDGKKYVLRRGRFGEFWAHPDYPKVKDARPLELTPAKQKEMYGEAPTTKDGRAYLLKSGRFGKFWAHPDYPEVKDVVRIKSGNQPAGAKAKFSRRKKRGNSKKNLKS